MNILFHNNEWGLLDILAVNALEIEIFKAVSY